MRTEYLNLVYRWMEKPARQLLLLTAAIMTFVCFSLYYLMLSGLRIQQRQLVDNLDRIGIDVVHQQRTLLLQPPYARLIAQTMPSAMQQATSTAATAATVAVSLAVQIAEPLEKSAGKLLHWLPMDAGVRAVSSSSTNSLSSMADKQVKRGEMLMQTDFRGLTDFLRRLLTADNPTFIDQFSLHNENSVLNVGLRLSSGSGYVSHVVKDAKFPDFPSRDPFSPQSLNLCNDNSSLFNQVVLGGVMGSEKDRKGWLMFPGSIWKKASEGELIGHEGWQVDSVTEHQVTLRLSDPPCADSQKVVRLPQRRAKSG